MWNLKIKNKQTKKEDHRITNLKNKYIVSIEENCGGGKTGEWDQQTQIFSVKKSQRYNIQHKGYSQ